MGGWAILTPSSCRQRGRRKANLGRLYWHRTLFKEWVDTKVLFPYFAEWKLTRFCKIDLILPQESWELVRETLLSVTCPVFNRVTMSLAQVLQGDFFTEYIKIGT